MTWKAWLALLVGVIIGFVSACTGQELLDAKKRSLAKRTAADCVSISKALENYRTDNRVYPPLDGNIEHLRGYLTPKYLRQLPTRDMSGEPYLVVANGSRAVVISVGRYGAAAETGTLIRSGSQRSSVASRHS